MADDRLRVAVLTRAVHPLHGVGGLERHVHDLVRHLIRQDVRVSLITRPPTSGASADVQEFGATHDSLRILTVPYVTFPGAGRRGTTVIDRSTAYPAFGWRAGRLALRLVRRGEIDIVHALGASALGYAHARRRDEFTVPFVLNPQGMEEFGGTHPGFAQLKRLAYLPLQSAVRASARAADAVIATDRALVATVARHLPVPPARIHTIPNAVDLDAIDRRSAPGDRAALRASFGVTPSEVLLLSVGRLEENKGFHVLARALGSLDQRLQPFAPTWRWVLVGAGPNHDRIVRAASDAGVQSRMIMPGRVDDATLEAWYRSADLFVHPTLYEGSSLVTLEAMAHGLAVVATRVGGLPDKVVPGQTGWLVEPGSEEALGAAVADALQHPTGLERLGAGGRALVSREFSWPAVADRTLALYRMLRQR